MFSSMQEGVLPLLWLMFLLKNAMIKFSFYLMKLKLSKVTMCFKSLSPSEINYKNVCYYFDFGMNVVLE